ncbi:hypothetical protein, partial [Sphingomonas sp. ABOLH]|uniref:hypothetical protein n=1 Tax=Sphingomonas sp. ABOLH TaxID=1985881 RepID=UPI0019D11E8C
MPSPLAAAAERLGPRWALFALARHQSYAATAARAARLAGAALAGSLRGHRPAPWSQPRTG